ncbi:MAG: CotH kinase family protein [Deltaproteobacteria bacterium]|nr:CotH kinase family protein [Deltaproteobacteria bacterium]
MLRCSPLLPLVLLTGCVGGGLLGGEEPRTPAPPDNEPFWDLDHVLEVDLSLAPEDWDALRAQRRDFASVFAGDCRDGPYTSSYTYFPADLTVDGQSLPNIGARKKGFIGSQSTTKPGLRLNLDEFVDGAELFGVDNITLNNAVQDPSLLKQCLVYSAFAEAGVPTPRCNFAHVTVNGDELGIYVHVEPIKRSFLRRAFGTDDGDLYEGTLSDVHPAWVDTFEAKTDSTDETLGPLRALGEDLQASEDVEATLSDHLDLDRFLTFWAMEIWTAHWDGYAGNQNNFHVYRDPATDLLHFIPWGADGTLQEFEGRSPFFGTGYIANRILGVPALRDRLLDRIDDLGEEVWTEGVLLDRIDAMESRLAERVNMQGRAGPIEQVRQYVVNASGIIAGAAGEAPQPFRSPFCLRAFGAVEADFETTWGSASGGFDGIWDAGEVDLEVQWGEFTVPFSRTGVMMGPAGEAPGWGNLLMSGEMQGDNGLAYVIPYATFPLDAAAAGAPLPFDGTGPNASLLYADATTNWQPVQAAMVFGGQLTFGSFGTGFGDEVAGTLSTQLYEWAEEE